jgi:hypothetical protein
MAQALFRNSYRRGRRAFFRGAATALILGTSFYGGPLSAQSQGLLRLTLLLGGSPYHKTPLTTDLGVQLLDAASGQPAYSLVIGDGPDFEIPVIAGKAYRAGVWQGGIQIGEQELSGDSALPAAVSLSLFPKAELRVRATRPDGVTPLPSGFVVEIYDRKDPADPVTSQMGLQSRVLTREDGVAPYSYLFPTHYSGGNGYTVVVRDPGNSLVLGRATNVQVAPGGSGVTIITSSMMPVARSRMVAVDLKSRAVDKTECAAIVAGVAAHIAVTEWIKVKEFGEDYSVWFGGLKRIRHGDSVTVLLTIDVRTPASIGGGRNIAARQIKFTYAVHAPWNGEPAIRQRLERRWPDPRIAGLRGRREEMIAEGLFVGEHVVQVLREMIPQN